VITEDGHDARMDMLEKTRRGRGQKGQKNSYLHEV
jgi:hypothetical protein